MPTICKILCCAQLPYLCPILCDPMDCSLPGSSVHGILQGGILEWGAMPSTRGSCPPRNWSCVSWFFFLTISHVLMEENEKSNNTRLRVMIESIKCKWNVSNNCKFTHSSVLAWRIPGTDEPGRLPSVGSHRVGHDWSDLTADLAACLLLVYILAVVAIWESLELCSLFNECMLLLLLSHFSRVRLCDPIDVSPRGSPVPGILQARTPEWVAISFSNAGKWKVRVKSLSHVWLLVTPWTAAHQAPPSMGFSRQEYWSGLPFPTSGDLPDPEIESLSLASPSLAGGFFTTAPPGLSGECPEMPIFLWNLVVLTIPVWYCILFFLLVWGALPFNHPGFTMEISIPSPSVIVFFAFQVMDITWSFCQQSSFSSNKFILLHNFFQEEVWKFLFICGIENTS